MFGNQLIPPNAQVKKATVFLNPAACKGYFSLWFVTKSVFLGAKSHSVRQLVGVCETGRTRFIALVAIRFNCRNHSLRGYNCKANWCLANLSNWILIIIEELAHSNQSYLLGPSPLGNSFCYFQRWPRVLWPCEVRNVLPQSSECRVRSWRSVGRTLRLPD